MCVVYWSCVLVLADEQRILHAVAGTQPNMPSNSCDTVVRTPSQHIDALLTSLSVAEQAW